MNWINTNDELPELRADVLMCTAGRDEILIGWRGDDGQWATWSETLAEVTHWMPLPDVPRAMSVA